MPSFDVVSRTDLAEVDNAVRGAAREITVPSDTILPLPSTTQIEVSLSDTSIPT
jgi:uncharacterized protein YajQ (UPF0234 family)